MQIYTITDEGWGWSPAFIIPKLLPSLCPGSPSIPTLHQILKALTLRTQTIPIGTTWSNWIRNKQKTHPIILLLLLNSPIFLPFTSHLSEQDSWNKTGRDEEQGQCLSWGLPNICCTVWLNTLFFFPGWAATLEILCRFIFYPEMLFSAAVQKQTIHLKLNWSWCAESLSWRITDLV